MCVCVFVLTRANMCVCIARVWIILHARVAALVCAGFVYVFVYA